MSLFDRLTFFEQAIFRILEPHNFFSNFWTRCEYIERNTPSKNILEFLKHFSSRSHIINFFGDNPVDAYSFLKIGFKVLKQL